MGEKLIRFCKTLSRAVSHSPGMLSVSSIISVPEQKQKWLLTDTILEYTPERTQDFLNYVLQSDDAYHAIHWITLYRRGNKYNVFETWGANWAPLTSTTLTTSRTMAMWPLVCWNIDSVWPNLSSRHTWRGNESELVIWQAARIEETNHGGLPTE
jgi:hypothetical protein